MDSPVYLDHNSTTPVDPRVLEAMTPYFLTDFGNASSKSHAFGWKAEEAVKTARAEVATAIGSSEPRSILFTSGATESNNLAILGIANALSKPAHFITQNTEHASVLDVFGALERQGHAVTILPVDETGRISAEQVANAIRPDTALCSIMAANNEIGTLQPIDEIAAVCKKHQILFHTDAVQAVGKIPIAVEKSGVDLLSLSAHKFYGPKGVGALYVARKQPAIAIDPLFFGGGHERGFRSGTLNVPGIVGLAKALSLCIQEQNAEAARLTALRDAFIRRVLAEIPHSRLNGHTTLRLPSNANFSFLGVKADQLLLAMPKIAVSTGSACSSETTEPSYVIRALGGEGSRATSAIRFGLGRSTTATHLDLAMESLLKAIPKLRSQSLEYEMLASKVD